MNLIDPPARGQDCIRDLGRIVAVVLLAALPGCFHSDGVGPLFGGDTGGGGQNPAATGFEPGINGGVILRDLFLGARISDANPTITRVVPAEGTEAVSTRTSIFVEFSESILASTLQNNVTLFPSGSSTVVPGTTLLAQGQTAVVFLPQDDLLAGTQYEIVVNSNITDLQGRQIQSGGSSPSASQRFSFRTAAATSRPPLQVMAVSPAQQSGNQPKSSEIVVTFSEPVAETGVGGIATAGNVVVKVNNATQTLGTDYSLTLFPDSLRKGLRIAFTSTFTADSTVRVEISNRVESLDGVRQLSGGNGFASEFTVQDFQTPAQFVLPTVGGLSEDGFISVANLGAYPTAVSLSADGQTAEDVTLIYFDRSLLNALVFEKAAASPTLFNVDLMPEAASALNDGDILVGSFSERRGFRSDVTLVGTLVKDTVGPRVEAVGPPEVLVGGFPVFYSTVSDPVLYGRMDEPCQGIQADFDGAGSADFSSIRLGGTLSTITDDFFLTGISEDAPLAPRLEPYTTFSLLAADQFGNGSINVDALVVATVGVTGAAVSNAAVLLPSTALVVSAFAGNVSGGPVGDFASIGRGAGNGVVVIDEFPPDATGTRQIVRGLTATAGVAMFTDADLSVLTTPQMTVTVIANGFAVLSFAGLDVPDSTGPVALLPVLPPSPTLPQRSDVIVNLANQNNSATIQIGAAEVDVDPATEALEVTRSFAGNAAIATNLSENQLQILTGTEIVANVNFKFSSSQPFTAEPIVGPGGTISNKTRTVDFNNRASYNFGAAPSVFEVEFDNTLVTAPSPLGLIGTEATQFRRLSLMTRLPGFTANTALASTSTFALVPVGPNGKRGRVAKPPSLDVNDTTAGTGAEDLPLELILQPDLSIDTTAVDPAVQNRNLRLEVHVEDRTGANLDPSGAFVRERFLLSDPPDTTTNPVVFQAVPAPALTSATHPPLIEWPEVVAAGVGAGVHRMNLVSEDSSRAWQVFLPSVAAAGTVSFQLPNITLPMDGSTLVDFDFDFPVGTYRLFVESFSFDGNPDYTFDINAFFQTDLEREHMLASRSNPQAMVTTN